MNPLPLDQARTAQPPVAGKQPRENLIAVWPDETWCAYEDIHKMSHRNGDYQILRVAVWGEDGEPVSFERVQR